MEPGHEDREEAAARRFGLSSEATPQWSPVTRTGKSGLEIVVRCGEIGQPQWSPVTRTGKRGPRTQGPQGLTAAMEPGHEDREERTSLSDVHRVGRVAAMEPGHEDREEEGDKRDDIRKILLPQWSPVTRTGKSSRLKTRRSPPRRRNGARSRGPGRVLNQARRQPSPEVAAMEPGHEDREEENLDLLHGLA